MVWVLVFGGIALLGLVMVASYAVWLSHKVADVWSEVRVLADRGSALVELLAQIQPAELRRADPNLIEGEVVPAADREAAPAT